MRQNPHFIDMLKSLQERDFLKAKTLVLNYVLTHPQPDNDVFSRIQSDYKLMEDYWRKGFDDPQRMSLYNQLLHRLYTYVSGMLIRDRIDKSPLFSEAWGKTDEQLMNEGYQFLQRKLETYVSDIAMLEFEPENLRKVKSEQLYREHQQFMSRAFNTILTSEPLRDSDFQPLKDLLLSPTVDSIDQQHIVSALMLSCMLTFCYNKFRLLYDIHKESVNEEVKQRAFVGWVFSIDSTYVKLYPEILSMIEQQCSTEKGRDELVELQMQIVYCMLADNDSKTIKDQIMPELMKSNEIQMGRSGIIDMDETRLEDILHPDAAEENMERMEAVMKKMADMQKRGSDIYFAGFSQMKRFPFFSDLTNWFVPFYPQHPLISPIWNNARGNKFLKTITSLGAFCDSDKYSFVLVFEQVFSHLPGSMLQMIENGEASPMALGGEVPLDEQRRPAFIRRMYLQNMYRFFRIFPNRSEFPNPFDAEKAVFFSNNLFALPSMANGITQVASFLIKQNLSQHALAVLDNQVDNGHTLAYHLLMGQMLSNRVSGTGHSDRNSAAYHYSEALKLDPSNQRALMGYARSSFSECRYADALNAFRKLFELNPSVNIELNIAICLIRNKQLEEALKILYRLHYNEPDNNNVIRSLAWAQTLSESYDSAEKIYERLTKADDPLADDFLNYGYCLWFQNKIETAIPVFKQYIEKSSSGLSDAFREERSVLSEHGITDLDILLMTYVVS